MALKRSTTFINCLFDVKRRFHEKSYHFMKLIKSDFCYLKYKASEDLKDIAKLYLNFFTMANMQNRIEELKRAYASVRTIGVWYYNSTICLNSCM